MEYAITSANYYIDQHHTIVNSPNVGEYGRRDVITDGTERGNSETVFTQLGSNGPAIIKPSKNELSDRWV